MSKEAEEKPALEPKEVIGSGINKGVIKQLKAREELISSRNKENNQLLYFNANGSWARIISSVNTLTEDETKGLSTGKKTIANVTGDSTLAKNNILMGGTLNPQGNLSGGVNESKYTPLSKDAEGFITPQSINSSAYNNYETLGFRPTPGITGVDIKSKGTYGSLRQAEITVSVWSLEDLEMMQALYLRPGFTLLLEWGHSLQLASDTKEVTSADQFYKKFLKDKVKAKELERGLKELVEESDYNYDSMFGYVSNFSWSFRNDGGYDCSIKLISKGSVLESIAVTFDPSKVYPPSQFEKRDEDKRKIEKKSIFHKLFSELEKLEASEEEGVLNVLEAGFDTYVDNVVDGATAIGQAVTGDFSGAADTLKDIAKRNIKFMLDLPTKFFGDKTDLALKIQRLDSVNAQQAMANPGFAAKFEALPKAGYYMYNGKKKEWRADRGVMDLEEDELVEYLTKGFGEYGFTFEFNKNGVDLTDKIFITARNGDEVDLECDNYWELDDFNETLRLMEFLQEKAVIPPPPQPSGGAEPTAESLELQATAEAADTQREAAQDTTSKDEAWKRGLQPIFTLSNFSIKTGQYFKETLNSFVAFKLKDLEYKDTGWADNDDVINYWIPLHCILDVYNNFITLLDGTQEASPGTKSRGRKLTEFYTGWQDKNTATRAYQKQLKYLTNDNHFSIDPLKCILPKRCKTTQLYDSKGEKVPFYDGFFDGGSSGEDYPIGLCWKNGFHYNVEKAFSDGLMRGDENDILNILFPVEFLKLELDKIVDASKDADQNEGDNMLAFLRTILKGANDAMGNINDFDVFYDEDDDLFYIVDRKVTPPSKNFIPTLSLSGLKTTVSKLSIDSKISSNIASMISIAAQGAGGHTKDNIRPMLEWNRGLLDRHIIHKAQENTAGGEEVTEERENPADERLRKWVEEYQSYWDEFNGNNLADNGDYDAKAVGNLKSFHKEFCQRYVVDKLMYTKDSPIPPPGVIPVELSFSMMGTGGLKIGQAFRIEPGLLPQEYSERFGFLITGLSHSLSDSKWITDIKTQFYSMTPPSPDECEEFEKKNKTESIAPQPPKNNTREPISTTSLDSSGTTSSTPSGLDEEVTPLTPGTELDVNEVDYDAIQKAVVAKGYKWKTGEYELNLVGIRNLAGNNVKDGKQVTIDRFNDIFTVSWLEGGKKYTEKFACTTDPGKHYTDKKFGNASKRNPKGTATAQLKPGQYASWKLDYHRKDKNGTRHPAFSNRKTVTVYRDNVLANGFHDISYQESSHRFGINLHRAAETGKTTKINRYSAGCQVLDEMKNLDRILHLAYQQNEKNGKRKRAGIWTYTLLTSNEVTL